MLRVLELFAGIGACSKALTNLGIEHEIVDAVEIDKYAVASFNAVHGTNFAPQDITKWDKDIQCDLIMHGSPCQDFSVAGKGAGGDEGSGTRSSLMYETLRIVEKLKPKYVIWENVKNVLSKKHKHNFDAYLERMESLGYKNHYQVLNAKDYSIPQNRERVFTISILADYDFDFKFPEKKPLDIRLKDILESHVDESFYLSDVQVGKIKMSTYNQNRTRIQEGDVAQTLCARDWKDPKCVKVGDLDIKGHDAIKRVYDAEGLSPTLTTMGGGNREPKIIDPQGRLNKVNTPKDYAPTLRAQDHGNPPMAIVDDTYANRDARVYAEYSPALRSERSGLKVTEPFIVASRGRNPDNPSDRTAGSPTVQRLEPRLDGCTNTLTSVQKDNHVAIKTANKTGYDLAVDGDGIDLAYPDSKTRRGRVGHGVSKTLPTSDSQGVMDGYRIRKLTPLECWRLMGFDDTDFHKAEKVNSNTQLYKQAGNSIVVNVLEAILKELLDGNAD